MNEIKISTGVIAALIFCTWVFMTVLISHQNGVNTENRMRIERLEDVAFGLNVPITQTVKQSLTEGK